MGGKGNQTNNRFIIKAMALSSESSSISAYKIKEPAHKAVRARAGSGWEGKGKQSNEIYNQGHGYAFFWLSACKINIQSCKGMLVHMALLIAPFIMERAAMLWEPHSF